MSDTRRGIFRHPPRHNKRPAARLGPPPQPNGLAHLDSPSSDTPESPAENRLATESSAYLLQHKHNPVDWYPWGEEALERARGEDRPLLVSIGYSACHWCHVMERESFEDLEIAAFINANFVAIKVDREERPDIDSIYMDAVRAMTGRGGWPLTAILNAEREPFFGGTHAATELFGGRVEPDEDAVAVIGPAKFPTPPAPEPLFPSWVPTNSIEMR